MFWLYFIDLNSGIVCLWHISKKRIEIIVKIGIFFIPISKGRISLVYRKGSVFLRMAAFYHSSKIYCISCEESFIGNSVLSWNSKFLGKPGLFLVCWAVSIYLILITGDYLLHSIMLSKDPRNSTCSVRSFRKISYISKKFLIQFLLSSSLKLRPKP